ncbi:hypothetical protein BBH88_04520 [Planococcus antarcticus DSM 14505]|uniref:DNA phosphorothioation-dependent restriction protein DptF n=1 Tax=Planococcus antarcticus DSM 14505 TaxID=1185653 RepID=A0ABM6D2K0_9BACL|nr:hypothetical protein [Planococcus antarcticus]ANU09611.1 hypothetical protein BBH88_04520 [Planococcus antarcticus DSM 14505]
MTNSYIKYLQSMNNASSANDNAIAESQITNSYYDHIRIERELGTYLIDTIKEKPSVILLTGHAGDGKTGLLHQILRTFNVIRPQDNLKIKDICFIEELSSSLLYVKDMSELSLLQQVAYLKEGFEVKAQGGSAIIISNTGPLIEAFKEYEKTRSNDADLDAIEMEILEMMDNNNGEAEFVGQHEVVLINLARIDNTGLVPMLFEKILQPDLWSPCQTCGAAGSCPIYNNYNTIQRNKESVTTFIEAFYRWLYETEKRLTIRQILAHLTYSVTGNLDCETLSTKRVEENLYNYHFANLFFGFIGTKSSSDALKIKAIREIQSLRIDEKDLPHNYNIFVRNDFSKLKKEVRHLTEKFWINEMRFYNRNSSNLHSDEKPYLLRKAMRRMQVLFGEYSIEEQDMLLAKVFVPVFPKYLKMTEEPLKKRELRILEQMIIRALNIILVGNTEGLKAEGVLYLPLKRNDGGAQNVQLLLGKVETNEISIVQEKVDSKFDKGISFYQIELNFSKIKGSFPLSLLLLDYFDNVARGSVSTKLNPSLTHGVDKMKAKIYKSYKFNDKNEEIKILVQTLQGPLLLNMELEEDSLYVE